jgi:hypothetical protein
VAIAVVTATAIAPAAASAAFTSSHVSSPADGSELHVIRRHRGSGSIFEQRGAWYGKWWLDGRQVKRKLGPRRSPGATDGLTKPQAERRLRQLMEELTAPPVVERLTVEQAGKQQLRHLDGLGRKTSTVQGVRVLPPRSPRPVLRKSEPRPHRASGGRGVHGGVPA